MMNALDKLCPMKRLNGYCIGERCAWWLEFAKECAVPVAAGILADSTICRNVFDEAEREKDNAEM